jgi:hypothetical protein
MPHKRKKTGGFCPALEFDPAGSVLYLSVHRADESWLEAPLATAQLLLLLRHTGIATARVALLRQERRPGEVTIQLARAGLPLGVEGPSSNPPPLEVAACRPPVWYLPGQRTCVAGLCSVARYLLRLAVATEGSATCRRLLGHQQACLSAPAEVSTWTNFCEVEAARVLAVLGPTAAGVPEAAARMEAHLGHPVRMHNIRRSMQQSGSVKTRVEPGGKEVLEEGGEEDPVRLFARMSHVYLEGPELLLSDLLLYPVFHLVDRGTDLLQEDSPLPHTAAWLALMAAAGAAATMEALLGEEGKAGRLPRACLPLPAVPQHSLYKSDKTRDGSSKVFTRQAEVERALGWWAEAGPPSLQAGEQALEPLNWEALPALVRPGAGALPPARQARKAAQLESLARPVVELARPGDTVVDFCAGGGHLGLLLAHLLPAATVHMVENKEESLARARARGLAMQGGNTWFFQCNLDYYRGSFEVGCSLHACGLATDLVLAKCTAQRAAFVCCPCCYGGVAATECLTYPRSAQFAELPYSLYLSLGHAADQTEPGTTLDAQGVLCMDLVDTDRALAVRELGYKVTLAKLSPPDCTPKNNLLVGVLPR